MTDPNPSEAQKKPRVSGTAHPYNDLPASEEVAAVMYAKGGGSAAGDQLAAWLGYSGTSSGTFQNRIGAARQFGLIETIPGGYAITERGRKILAPVMPDDSLNGRVDAFLGIDLFSKVYEQFKGSGLPPEAGLKNLFLQTYKILPDRVTTALRVFFNSAEHAGFFKATGDRSRLVKPTAHPTAATPADGPKRDETAHSVPDKSRGPSVDGPVGVHTAIIGLLRDLPPPGTTWPPKKKQRFMDAFKAAIDHIYPEDDEG
ncbi:MAG: hypothetical protein IT482_12355 [Gammaproteobacteria bacterium]|nr:hypothetical protein [Gammaproteobacteria bacterium]